MRFTAFAERHRARRKLLFARNIRHIIHKFVKRNFYFIVRITAFFFDIEQLYVPEIVRSEKYRYRDCKSNDKNGDKKRQKAFYDVFCNG